MTNEAAVDLRSDTLRLLTHGVYVLTTCDAEVIHTATVSWVSQVSIKPPLVLAALRRNSHLAQAVRQARRFTVNILGADQHALAKRFFRHTTLPAHTSDAVAQPAFRMSSNRCALLPEALGWLECRLTEEAPSSGDHALLLGEVIGAGIRRPDAPMVLGATPWSYGGLNE